MAQHRHKAALLDGEGNAAEALQLVLGVFEMYIFKLNNRAQSNALSAQRSQRQVAPQGSTRPVSVTGNPSSRPSCRTSSLKSRRSGSMISLKST